MRSGATPSEHLDAAGGPALAVAALLGRAGRGGRRAAVALDTAALLGPRRAWRTTRRARSQGVPGPPARDAVYRQIWEAAAAAVGADFRDLGSGFAELQRAGTAVRVFHQVTPLDDPVALRVALDKPLAHRLLAAEGLRVPEYVAFSFSDERPALDLLERVGRCVVKPAVGTAGGEGVTSGVSTATDLRRARCVRDASERRCWPSGKRRGWCTGSCCWTARYSM